MFAPPVEAARIPARTPASHAPAVQPKLRIGPVDDPLEHEADRMADAVLAGTPLPASSARSGLVQRSCAACEEQETVRRAPLGGDGGRGAFGDGVPAALSRGGVPMPADLRAYFEPRFGRDFSAVRLHADGAAGEAAHAIDARAFTLGRDIAFAPGEYAPSDSEGRRLLAHELAHIVQQDGAASPAILRRQPFAGCDRRTTGVDDADPRLKAARVEAEVKTSLGSDNIKDIDQRTLRLLDRHFHCPSTTQIAGIAAMLAKMEAGLVGMDANCLDAKNSICAKAIARYDAAIPALLFCPGPFTTTRPELGLMGVFVWGAAVEQGAQEGCVIGSSCYDDFTVPASDMVTRAEAYEGFVLESGFVGLGQPETIPCRPRNIHLSVVVPPGAATDPRRIRPLSPFDDPPPRGSRVVPVWEDTAGKRFIYTELLPGAKQYLPEEGSRLYLPDEINLR
jgi:hypothetical protein